jgi:hypothetical protein
MPAYLPMTSIRLKPGNKYRLSKAAAYDAHIPGTGSHGEGLSGNCEEGLSKEDVRW